MGLLAVDQNTESYCCVDGCHFKRKSCLSAHLLGLPDPSSISAHVRGLRDPSSSFEVHVWPLASTHKVIELTGWRLFCFLLAPAAHGYRTALSGRVSPGVRKKFGRARSNCVYDKYAYLSGNARQRWSPASRSGSRPRRLRSSLRPRTGLLHAGLEAPYCYCYCCCCCGYYCYQFTCKDSAIAWHSLVRACWWRINWSAGRPRSRAYIW